MSRRISRDIDSVNENQDLWGTLNRSAAHPRPTLNLHFRPITHLAAFVYNFSPRINDLSVNPWPYYPEYPQILKHYYPVLSTFQKIFNPFPLDDFFQSKWWMSGNSTWFLRILDELVLQVKWFYVRDKEIKESKLPHSGSNNEY